MANDTLIAQRTRLRGRIQGDGFRPFTVRLAQRLDVAPTTDREPRAVGMVVNRPAGGVPLRVARRP